MNRMDFNLTCEIAKYIPDELCSECANWKFQCTCAKVWNHPIHDLYDLGLDLPSAYVWKYLHCNSCSKELPLEPIDSIINNSIRFCSKTCFDIYVETVKMK